MKLSPDGIAQLSGREALRLVAYKDSGGVPTIGWGHTKGVKMGQRITRAQALAFLAADLAPTELDVNAIVRSSKVPVTQPMYDALVSFAFNVGDQGFAHSTVAHMLQQGNKKGAADAFLMWNKVKGRTSQGLVNRRRAERKQFLA